MRRLDHRASGGARRASSRRACLQTGPERTDHNESGRRGHDSGNRMVALARPDRHCAWGATTIRGCGGDQGVRVGMVPLGFSEGGVPDAREVAEAGYLVVAATTQKFGRPSEFGTVLNGQANIATADLFSTYAGDWLDLLRHGSGRPVTLPGRIGTEVLVQTPLRNAPGWEIRAVKVLVPQEPGQLVFASESWPVGHPRLAEPKSPKNLPLYPPSIRHADAEAEAAPSNRAGRMAQP